MGIRLRTLRRTTGAGRALTAGILLLPLSAAALVPESAAAAEHPVRLSHLQAAERLEQAGLRWISSGECADRDNRRCTSFEEMRVFTLRRVIKLKRCSGCPVVLTGGTENGHERGRYSHRNGYKVDVALDPCIDRYITGRYAFIGRRDDGARLYRAPRALYARTSSHWDILFR
ncbi:hypothetical protein [Planobispora longispora]|uniref:Uncharacterized protein n=1 Tax=Planobispora longispora TaxID=28887 RepID=A0A8J3W4E7_9ACTN|nr:hypothetical protein [Planobispora longispora]GIH75380.1 hypothetical protein Plo01_18090 [Planobispora longispora]